MVSRWRIKDIIEDILQESWFEEEKKIIMSGRFSNCKNQKWVDEIPAFYFSRVYVQRIMIIYLDRWKKGNSITGYYSEYYFLVTILNDNEHECIETTI